MYILITGGFDPIHSGHLSLIKHANSLGKVVIGLNSDDYLIRKKGTFLLPYVERLAVINSIRNIYSCIDEFDDSNNSSCYAIDNFYTKYKDKDEHLAFANGGDVLPTSSNIEEYYLCKKLGIITLFGLGNYKTVSSSNFLTESYSRYLKK